MESKLEKKQEQKEDLILARAEEMAGKIFDFHTHKKRISLIMKELESFFDAGHIDRDEIEKHLNLVNQADRKSFITGVLQAVEPILKFISEQPEEYEKLRRTRILDMDGYIKVNDLLYYGKSGDGNIHIHIAPHEQTKIGTKIGLFRKGLKKLAEEVNNNQDVDKITATSWVIAEAPKLMELLGFRLHGEVSDEFKQKYFPNEIRPVHHASISRDDLLKRYLVKNE